MYHTLKPRYYFKLKHIKPVIVNSDKLKLNIIKSDQLKNNMVKQNHLNRNFKNPHRNYNTFNSIN